MTTEVGICNRALGAIGVSEQITALTEGTARANACNLVYGDLRDEVLAAHEWGFATTRCKLARLAAAPAFGFANAFALPSDLLRISEVSADTASLSRPRYRIEDGRVLSDAADLYLRHIKRVTDPNAFSTLFTTALVFRLAWEIALAITQTRSIADDMRRNFGAAIAKARGVDSQEDDTPGLPEGGWITDRF